MGKKPTLADVAKKAGVSPSTASVVYSGAVSVSTATRDKVLAAAESLNYSGPDPRAASLRTGRSGVIGVMVADDLRIVFLDPVVLATMDGLAASIAPSGSGMLLLRDNEAGEGLSLESAPIDAVAIMGWGTDVPHAIKTLERRGIPAVVIEEEGAPAVPVVQIESYEAQRSLAQHVYELGHRDVALVTLPFGTPDRQVRDPQAVPPQSTRERIEGAKEIYPEAHMVVAERSSIDAGVQAAQQILEDPGSRPTAILAQSDLLAAGVLRAALDLGLRVPEDLSITGFDGVRVDGIAPYTITTMRQPAFEKGVAAGEALLRLLDGEETPSVRLACTFVPGNTTAPPAERLTSAPRSSA